MEKDRLRHLLEKQLANQATASEMQELSALLQNDDYAELYKTVMAEMMEQQTPLPPGNEQAWQKMADDIVQIDKSIDEKVFVIARRNFRLFRWAAAAAILIMVAAGAYFMMNRNSSSPTLAHTTANQNVLSIPRGKPILLDEVKDGVIARLGKIIVTKKDNVIFYNGSAPADENVQHVISTARGSNYHILLTDGSTVSLNAASSLRFPISFSDAKRSVELAGEAWFDVQHADRLPFSIRSGNITTTVLGTAFNIHSYPNEKEMKVSVERGKVQVANGHKILATLVKGQQVNVTNDSLAQIQAVDPAFIAAWKQGILYYENEPLHKVVADLQRVYKDSINIKTASLKEIRITARYQKKDGLQQILNMLCHLTESHFTKVNGIYNIEQKSE